MVMTAYLSVINKKTGNSPFIVNQKSLVMEQTNHVFLLSMISQYTMWSLTVISFQKDYNGSALKRNTQHT